MACYMDECWQYEFKVCMNIFLEYPAITIKYIFWVAMQNSFSTTGLHIHPLSVQVSQLFKTLDLNSMVMVQISL
jgi:hypothetical protein